MPHAIELAKTGRSSCRTCKTTIGKDELRIGEEVSNAFAPGETTFTWHHLQCAAKKKPSVVKQAIEHTDLEIPDKQQLMKTLEEAGKNEKPTVFPHAEVAPSGRALCVSCAEKIDKGVIRIAVQPAGDPGGYGPRSSYLHPKCAIGHTESEPQELFNKVKANSLQLNDEQISELLNALIG